MAITCVQPGNQSSDKDDQPAENITRVSTQRLTLDSVAGVPVWESADIAKDCVFRRYLKDGEIKRPKDGWYEMHPGDNRLELPKGTVPSKAVLRYVNQVQ